ncbi:MAG: hypothetical protein ACI4DV_00195 [Lachnospiraceae bacterium]
MIKMGTLKETHSNVQTEYRVDGTSVRKLRVVPQQSPERRPSAVPGRHHKKERATLSIPYCLFLGVFCVMTLMMGAQFLQLQALSTSNQKKIASLESQLTEMKKENNDELNRIESSINLDEIRDIAVNELGMVYAAEDNVVVYKNKRQDYVSQYTEVPQEEDSLLKSMINEE